MWWINHLSKLECDVVEKILPILKARNIEVDHLLYRADYGLLICSKTYEDGEKKSSFVEEVEFRSLADFYTRFKSLYVDHLSFGEENKADEMMTQDLKGLLDDLIKFTKSTK